MNKKTLATEAGFNPSNITKGIKNNSIPSAETAFKIAQKLGVTVEYLITGNEKTKKSYMTISEKATKYHSIIKDLDNLPTEKKNLVITLIKELKN